MPELAEVEFYRRRWDEAARGTRIRRIEVNAGKKVFRGTDVPALTSALTGTILLESTAAAKQMRFRFTGGASLGIHLGMSGELTVVAPETPRGRHDHLVLATDTARLVFTDPRMFGRILFHAGPGEPAWWTSIAPALTATEFTQEAVAAFLSRRRRRDRRPPGGFTGARVSQAWAIGWRTRFCGARRSIPGARRAVSRHGKWRRYGANVAVSPRSPCGISPAPAGRCRSI